MRQGLGKCIPIILSAESAPKKAFKKEIEGDFFMKAKIRNTEIYFDVAGMQLRQEGNQLIEKPVLFLLHGGPGGDHTRFKQHSLELQDVAQLVFIDHRGCGRSKKAKPKECTLENNIEDIEALRQYLGLKQIALLGVSYGGMVAQGYAIRYPKNVSQLILVASAPSFRFIKEAQDEMAKRGTPEQIAVAKPLWDGTFKNLQQLMRYFKITDGLYSVKAQKNPKATLRTTMTLWNFQALNQAFRTFLKSFDFIPQLKKIICPTLILAGENDWVCSVNQAKTMAKHIPNARLKIFKDCSHAIGVDAHEDYIRVVKHFLG